MHKQDEAKKNQLSNLVDALTLPEKLFFTNTDFYFFRQTTKIPFAKIAKTPRSSPTCENRIFSDEALRGPPTKIKNIFLQVGP